MIDAAPPPKPPVIEQPAPYATSYGVVAGLASAGAKRLIVRIEGRVVRDVKLSRRRFQVRVTLPLRETTVSIATVDARGRKAVLSVPHVQGMPAAATPRSGELRLEPTLQRRVDKLARAYRGTSSFYVVELTTGLGAAHNAQAVLPAGSTLKLGIAVVALAHADGVPVRGSRVDELLRRMLIPSDNVAANELERWVAGSTSAGSRKVNEMMRGIGLTHSEMYGGYIPGTLRRRLSLAQASRIPLRADDQPSWGVGKRTTAYDLATLLRSIWLASGGKGPLRVTQPGFTAADARYLLYLLARVDDPGKLDRFVRRQGIVVLHKAGWLGSARHDNGLVVWRGGIFVATVMTYRPSGVGTLEDMLAGRVVLQALASFRG